MKLEKVAALVGGSLKGNGEIEISDARGIEDAGQGQVTFVAKKKFLRLLSESKASAVIVDREIDTDLPQIVVANPMLAFAKLLNVFHPEPQPQPNIDSRAVMGENVKLGANVTIFPYVCIGDNVSIGEGAILHPGVVVGPDCSIGKSAVLHPNVTLYRKTTLGNRVILHAGVVIGADGFGYTLDEKGEHYKIPQIGQVVIEDDVEIGANTCIDRATLGATIVKRGTKIDNLVQIAHNCTIGEHSILVSQVGLAGSCTLGHHVVLAGQVGLADHVTIGDQAILTAQSGTFRDVESKDVQGGSPSVPVNTWRKYVTLLPKLPQLTRKIKDLEARLNAIEKK
ncbi:MAG: UDP-3-O-acylglucosamine N-acyltransferase [Nitrospinaceae bacterium]|nr:MAG: UDP-3-O-acylglucosamine N-acyltransferase [Nitrospinaceae bacterium]